MDNESVLKPEKVALNEIYLSFNKGDKNKIIKKVVLLTKPRRISTPAVRNWLRGKLPNYNRENIRRTLITAMLDTHQDLMMREQKIFNLLQKAVIDYSINDSVSLQETKELPQAIDDNKTTTQHGK